VPVDSFMSDGVTRQFIVSRWACSRMRARSIGKPSPSSEMQVQLDTNLMDRFRDIGYQHIPYFNCPNSPKCKGCVTGRFTDGESWLLKEDCRPNWFKFVGMG
jgi:hypothetical protein